MKLPVHGQSGCFRQLPLAYCWFSPVLPCCSREGLPTSLSWSGMLFLKICVSLHIQTADSSWSVNYLIMQNVLRCMTVTQISDQLVLFRQRLWNLNWQPCTPVFWECKEQQKQKYTQKENNQLNILDIGLNIIDPCIVVSFLLFLKILTRNDWKL